MSRETDLGNYLLINLPSVPRKILEKTLLETMSRHMEGKNTIGNNQQGFTNGKLWLNSLSACSEEMADMVGEGRAVVIYLDFHKACYIISLQPNW